MTPLMVLAIVIGASSCLAQAKRISTAVALRRQVGLSRPREVRVSKAPVPSSRHRSFPLNQIGTSDPPASTPRINDICARCGGLMVLEHYMDLQDNRFRST